MLDNVIGSSKKAKLLPSIKNKSFYTSSQERSPPKLRVYSRIKATSVRNT